MLNGKVAIITGAGSGFGKGIAERFAKAGAAVVANDLRESSLNEVLPGLVSASKESIGVAADVSTSDGVDKIVDAALQKFDRIDVLVNNAGYTHVNSSLLDVSEADLNRVIDVNIRSIYYFVRRVVPQMREKKGGSIVNIGSVGALRPRPGLGWYCAAKGAVNTLTKVMAVEFADHNIRVNCICPAAGDTGMMQASLGEDTPERRARVLGTIPLGRFATPADIASMAVFLSSDEAAFITGGIFPVDGGRSV
ncbi:MAG: SDR family oxidoreductase [Variibacter sp.]